MGKLLPGVNARVGAATAHNKNGLAQSLSQNGFERRLHANAVGLRLPAVVGRSPVRQLNKITHVGQRYRTGRINATTERSNGPKPATTKNFLPQRAVDFWTANFPNMPTANLDNPNYFRRYDESNDADFYGQPRLVNHIDDKAIRATTELYREYLPANGAILDLMSSWVSHLPKDVMYHRVAGLGMNEVELRANPQLTDYVVQNLNQNPQLPYPDGSFDGGMVTVSVQYLTNPVAVYKEIERVLRPGAPFLTVFSNRMFPTKAVAIWQSLDDRGHQQLVQSYYEQAGLFDSITVLDRSPRGWSDPLYVVVGRRTN